MTSTATEPGAPTALEVEHLLLDGVPVPCIELEQMHMPGLYAWWDLEDALDGLWPAGLAPVSTARPIYVGQAGTTFAERAAQMHLRKTRVSTLRRSLASLLADQLDLAGGARLARGHPAMFSLDPAAEARLTAWMREHLSVTTAEHSAPQLVEGAVIGRIVAPLNDTYAHHGPYWQRMLQHRVAFRARIAAND